MNQLENKVIYQIYPKSFCDSNGDGIGDIKGIMSKLDYLANLGVDYLWLSPINQSPQRDNGYDISDYYAIDRIFGTLDDLKNLIDEAAKRNINIMMDLVLNHTSTEHIWFQKALQGDSHYQDFYIFRDQPTQATSVFGGSAWNFAPSLGKYYLCLFDKTQADLNWDNPAVRNEMIAMVNYWLDFGIRGFRLDVIECIAKDIEQGIMSRGKHFLPYLQQLSSMSFGKAILSVGECWHPPLQQMQQMCNEQGLTQAFHFSDITHTQQPDKWHQGAFNPKKLIEILEQWQNNYTGIPALVMNNHDSPRLISLWLNDDQYRYESATLLISLYAMLRGNLYLYQGEEIGMTNAKVGDIAWYQDIETINAYAALQEQGLSHAQIMQKIMLSSRDNARVSMAWDASPCAGFSTSKPWLGLAYNHEQINVASDLASSRSIYRYYQNILSLRKVIYSQIMGKASFSVVGGCIKVEYPSCVLYVNTTSSAIMHQHPAITPLINNYNHIDEQNLLPYQAVLYAKP